MGGSVSVGSGWELRRIAFALAAVVLVVAAGCGDSEEEGVAAAQIDPSSCDPQVRDLSDLPSDQPITTTAPLVADDALPSAIASGFCSSSWSITYPGGYEYEATPRPVLAQEEAGCIGGRLVEELGVARARELRFGEGPWHLLGFALTNNSSVPSVPNMPQTPQIVRSEAESIAAVFEDCTDQWKLLLMLTVTEGADDISDEEAACAQEMLADDDARAILIGELDRAYDDSSQPDAVPFPELVEPLIAAFDECQISGLDWN